jgi:hypothetical protein
MNGDFESGFTGGVGDNWKIASSGQYAAAEDTGYDGKSQRITIPSNGIWGPYIYQTPVFTLGRTYNWSFWYKSDALMRAEIIDAQAENIVLRETITPSTQWKQVSILFTYSSQAANQLRFLTENVGTFWIDEVVLMERCSAADTNCDRCVEQQELIQYIAKWKSGQANLANLMEAIGTWKNGC